MPPGLAEFVVIANRLPVDRFIAPDGTVTWRTSPGGLVTALEPVMRRKGGAWIGWHGAPDEKLKPFDHEGLHLVPVHLSTQEVEEYYEGFSNATLWPLYHDVIAHPEFHREWWDSYVQVNHRFAERAARVAKRGATVWVQDYQLQLVPARLRELRPDLRIGLFLHIPFPPRALFTQLPSPRPILEGPIGAALVGFQLPGAAPNCVRLVPAILRAPRPDLRTGFCLPIPSPPRELFPQLPWRRQILEGLIGADLVGFQLPGAAQNFVRLVRERVGHKTHRDLIYLPDGRTVRAKAFPISIDSAGFEELARSDVVEKRAVEIRGALGNPRKVFLGVDRLDYTKGIYARLRAYAELIADGALDVEDAVFVQVATPSR